MRQSYQDWIRALPKAELHIHVEGSLEPDLMFTLAERNNIKIPFESEADVKKAYQFSDLKSFLDIYYQGCGVLQEEEDFYDLIWAYLLRAREQNIRYAEIFFDPQAHTERGVPFEKVINGLHRGMVQASSELAMSSQLIMCFMRNLSEDKAMETLEQALPYKNWIVGVGLDSGEEGNPPEKFVNVFNKAHDEGFYVVAHAGEEGPVEYIWQALDVLNVDRIDHGLRCLQDEKLVDRLISEQIPLTLCPLSNLKLRVVEELRRHPLKRMLDRGLCVTINSDDPAYFGGYLNENMLACQKALGLTRADFIKLAENGFKATFLPGAQRKEYLKLLAGV